MGVANRRRRRTLIIARLGWKVRYLQCSEIMKGKNEWRRSEVQSAVGMQCKFVAMSVATNSIPIRFGRVRKYLPNSTVPYRKVRYGTGRGKKVPAESNISIRSYVYRVYQMVRYTIIMTSGIHIVYQGLPTDSGCNNNQPASLGLSFTTNIPPPTSNWRYIRILMYLQ